jgi:hypothetical protein
LDAKGNAYDRFRADSTPLIILVDKKGTVSRVWLGYDPAKKADFLNEVVGAVDKLAKKGR